MGFIHLLNASDVPYRVPGKTPIVLADDTKEESLLSLHKTSDALYAITQMTESELQTLGIYESADSQEESPLFYTCLYVLDPQTLEVYMMRITRHNADGSNQDVRNITYSYDCGMSEFIKTGYIELLRHMLPSIAWGPDYVRTVKVTLDPGTANERTYLTESLQGDAVSITLPDGYQLYSDEALTQPWIDDGNYLSDLTLWAGRD